MKKRKSPIVLLTGLGIVACIAFGLQFVWSGSPTGAAGPDVPPPPPDVKTIGKPRAAESQTTVAQNLKGVMGGSSGSGPSSSSAMTPKGGPPGPGGASGPMILNPNHAPTGAPAKPQLNTSATSAQWYDKDSALDKN